MAREPKKLNELFQDTLKDIYFAEKKILSALPKMAKAARDGLTKTPGAQFEVSIDGKPRSYRDRKAVPQGAWGERSGVGCHKEFIFFFASFR